MLSRGFWALIALALFITLVIIVIWLFSDLEFRSPRSEHVKPSVRKEIGTFILILTGLEVLACLILITNASSAKYWIGGCCCIVGVFNLFRAIRSLGTTSIHGREDFSDPTNEIASLETLFALHEKVKMRRFASRLVEIPLVIALFVYFSGTVYFSVFDLFGIIFCLICMDINFLSTGVKSRKVIAALKAKQKEI